MTNERTLMTKRTFGLLSTLSVLSIAVFTAALVIAYPNASNAEGGNRGLSDTKSIDQSRTIANTRSDRQSATAGGSIAASASNPAIGTADAGSQTPQIADADTAQPQPAVPSPAAQSRQSAQPQQPTKQPDVVTFVRDTVDNIVTLLPI